jgi:hypothetical protein
MKKTGGRKSRETVSLIVPVASMNVSIPDYIHFLFKCQIHVTNLTIRDQAV